MGRLDRALACLTGGEPLESVLRRGPVDLPCLDHRPKEDDDWFEVPEELVGRFCELVEQAQQIANERREALQQADRALALAEKPATRRLEGPDVFVFLYETLDRMMAAAEEKRRLEIRRNYEEMREIAARLKQGPSDKGGQH